MSQALNRCVNCLPGQRDVDAAIRTVGEASKRLLANSVSGEAAFGPEGGWPWVAVAEHRPAPCGQASSILYAESHPHYPAEADPQYAFGRPTLKTPPPHAHPTPTVLGRDSVFDITE